MIVTLDIRVHS